MNKIQQILDGIRNLGLSNKKLAAMSKAKNPVYVFNDRGQLLEKIGPHAAKLKYSTSSFKNSLKFNKCVNGLYFSRTNEFSPRDAKMGNSKSLLVIYKDGTTKKFISQQDLDRHLHKYAGWTNTYLTRKRTLKLPKEILEIKNLVESQTNS